MTTIGSETEKMVVKDSDTKETKTVPRWVAILLIEGWILSHLFCFSGFDLPGLLFVHAWAGFYAILGFTVSKFYDNGRIIDGYPEWSYACCLMNHLGIMPLLLVCSYFTRSNTDQWLVQDIRKDVFASNILFSIMGSMLKDAYLVKDNPRTLMGFGYFLHHVVTITACCVSLSLGAAGGMTAYGAVIVEFSSGLANLHVMMKTPRTLTTYLVTTPAANVIATITGYNVWSLAVKSINTHAYAVAITLIMLIRYVAWAMSINTEVNDAKTSGDKALLMKTSFKFLINYPQKW